MTARYRHTAGVCDRLVCDDHRRCGEFPLDRAEDMDEEAVRILVENMRAGRRRVS